MKDEWQTKDFGECAVLVRETVSPLDIGDAPYIGLEHIEVGTLSLLGHGVASSVTSTKSRFQRGDILFGKLRPYFRKAVRTSFDGICSTDIWVIRAKEGVDQGFLYYCIASWPFVDFANAGSEGTRMPRAKWEYVSRYKILLPSLSEQRAIAHILGTLDDKIELNRRMNETLEEMARAIFKSWFVDFDPVRAKMDGSWRRGESLPGMPAEMYDLFPERLVDSELGEIPEGWRVGTLGTVLQQRIERCRPSLEIEAIPYVPIDCISSKSLFLTTNKSGKEARSSLTRFYQGDLLFGAMRPYYHKVCIAPFNGTTRTTAFVLFPKEPYDFGFSTMLLHAPDTIAYATRHSIGSTIPYAVWTSSLEEMQVILPPERIRKEFNRVVYPLLTKIPSVYFENRTLADLRDTLLPKLISGELRVGDAEGFVESTV